MHIPSHSFFSLLQYRYQILKIVLVFFLGDTQMKISRLKFDVEVFLQRLAKRGILS